MTDLLVKLYALPERAAPPDGVDIRRAFAAERRLVCDWVASHFTDGWASECETAFSRLPVACFIAVRDWRVLGFACYDAAARGLFGPTGVAEPERNHGIGSALLIMTLHDMAAQGYAYAVIGPPQTPGVFPKQTRATEISGVHPR